MQNIFAEDTHVVVEFWKVHQLIYDRYQLFTRYLKQRVIEHDYIMLVGDEVFFPKSSDVVVTGGTACTLDVFDLRYVHNIVLLPLSTAQKNGSLHAIFGVLIV